MATRRRRVIPGRKFGRWRVISLEPRSRCLCVCRCGTQRSLFRPHLENRRSRSCGCWNSELTASRNKTHGQSKRPEYQVWKAIHARCENPKHPQFTDYGGRGLRVCRRWSGAGGFTNFMQDMGDRPKGLTIERRSNSKGYNPRNCKWASRQEQNRNKRNNHLITAFGRTQCLKAWADEIGMHWATLRYRLVVRKMPAELAMTAQRGVANSSTDKL